jgi:hypothetical protein
VTGKGDEESEDSTSHEGKGTVGEGPGPPEGEAEERAEVRKTPSWPRSWANFSLF